MDSITFYDTMVKLFTLADVFLLAILVTLFVMLFAKGFKK
jgi:hypothetical protein